MVVIDITRIIALRRAKFKPETAHSCAIAADAQFCTLFRMASNDEAAGRALPFAGEDLSDPLGEGQPHILRSYESDEIRRWIKVLCRMSGLSPTTLAKRAGVAPSTVNRFLNDRTVKHRLSATTLQKLDSAAAIAYESRVPIAYGQFGEEKVGYKDTPAPEDQAVQLRRLPNLPLVRVLGAVQAGFWNEAVEWPPSDQYFAGGLRFPGFDGYPQFGLEVRGTSMNRLYPEGTVIICVPMIHVDRNPVPGERVIVQRHRPDGLVEATVKEFQLDERGRVWLWPRSNDPEFQQPVLYHGTEEEGETIVISALVIGSIRPETPEAMISGEAENRHLFPGR